MNCRMAIPARIINSFTAGPNAATNAPRALAIAGAEFSTAVKTPINAAWIAGAAAAIIAAAAPIPDATATRPAAIAGPAEAARAKNAVKVIARSVNAPKIPMMTRPRTPMATDKAIRPMDAGIARYPAAIRIPRPIPIAQRPLERASQLRPAVLDSASTKSPRALESNVSATTPNIAPVAAYDKTTSEPITSNILPTDERISLQLYSLSRATTPAATFNAMAVRIKAPAPTIAVGGIKFAIATRSSTIAASPTRPWTIFTVSISPSSATAPASIWTENANATSMSEMDAILVRSLVASFIR